MDRQKPYQQSMVFTTKVMFSHDFSLDTNGNILDSTPMARAAKFSKSYLQTLSTDTLFQLADQYGLFLSADLTRHLLISELLELEDEKAPSNESDTAHNNTLPVKDREIPHSYNITEIRIALKDPIWFFVFWDFHRRLFTELQEETGFSFFFLRVHSLATHDKRKSVDFFDVQIPAEDRKRYVHVSFDEYLHRVDLMARFADGHEQVLAQSNIVEMQRKNIPQRLCVSQNTANRIISLSGLAALKKSHFQHYRQAFR